MAAVREGRLGRSMGALAFGVVRDITAKQARLAPSKLDEREQQFQIDISGDADATIAWRQIDLKFRVLFVNATGQRDSPYTLPTFTYGASISSGTPVMVTACVLKYAIEHDESVTGCRIAVGAASIGQGAIGFRGKLHACFQGYGAPNENEEDEG